MNEINEKSVDMKAIKANFRRNERMNAYKMFKISLPIITALVAFLISACYIAYRMISDYNYNEKWKDYDECGLG